VISPRCSPAPQLQRAITLWAVRRAVEEAGLAGVDWVTNAVTALERGDPLPPPFDDNGTAWTLLFDDDRIKHTLVTSLDRQTHDHSQQYRPGDRVCLFGFSRGAYTARSRVEMRGLHVYRVCPGV
jgi:hypothetical protein